MTQRVLLSLLLVILILPLATGQQPQPLPSPATQKPATPQNPPEIDSQDVVRITANLVQVDAVVTKNGKQVTDLKAEDFEIFEDGKPQTITNFSYISNLPASAAVRSSKTNDANAPVPPAKINAADQRRVMAVVIDDLGISFESMTQVRKQLMKLLDDVSPNDLVAIMRTGGDVGSLQQFTNDRRVLQNTVDRLRWNPCSRAGVYVFARAGSMGSNTGLCSQLIMNSTLKSLRFIIKGMSYLPGRKSLVVLSDYLPIQDQMPSAADETKQMVGDSSVIGSMSESMSRSDSPDPNAGLSYAAQLQRIAELAIRASVVIYSVDTRGLQYTGLTAADRLTARTPAEMTNQINSIMRSRSAQLLSGREGSDLIARQTGGFLIRNSNDFGLNQVMNDQQGYYLIGFRPAEETFNRKFHHIKAQVKRGGLSLRTRAGFYGFTDEEARPKDLSVADRMTKALMSPFGAKDITMRLTSFFFDDPSQGPVVRSFLYLDQHDLNFTEGDGWHIINLDIKSIMFGENGRVMAQEDRSGRLRLRGDAYEHAVRDGVVYSFDVPVKPRGAFQFRVAVRDIDSDRIGSAGQFIDIPNPSSGRLALSGIVAHEETATQTPAKGIDDVATGPAVRRFQQGATLVFAYAIYNASAPGGIPPMTAQMRVFRDGKVVFSGDATPINFGGQSDLKRLTNALRLKLGTDMIPGDYVFQVIVTDKSDKQKPRVASQWIDFEVIK